EVQLAVGQGVVFSVGEAVPGASHLKVDLLVYKRGQSNYDVKSGAADGFNRMPMNTFKSGGVRQTFASLDDVPAKLPGNDNQDEFVDRVKTGNGMVVMNNIGDGHTKVWVKQVIASAGLVVLQFEPIPAK
ncbi:MAG: hypothetical protein KC502_14515, partial [Myxococcales bacterium]|nr:hypothetical protein [Myxococcales bacterium]